MTDKIQHLQQRPCTGQVGQPPLRKLAFAQAMQELSQGWLPRLSPARFFGSAWDSKDGNAISHLLVVNMKILNLETLITRSLLSKIQFDP